MAEDKFDIHGWIALDKPKGLSSARAVGRVKRALGAKKAGHAGTLDPLASGLLAIALGEATKTASFAMAGRKIYHFTIAWGAATETDDSEGEIIATSEMRPKSDEIKAILPDFTGLIMQKPPAYSALKVDGKRAYKLARAGEQVDLAPRPIEIDALSLLEGQDVDHADFTVTCAKGTYIRSLARDIAEKLGGHGHVSALRRVKSGSLDEKHMISLDKLEELSHIGARQEALSKILLPVETVLDDIPVLAVSAAEADRLKSGQAIAWRDGDAASRQDMVFVASNGCPIAMAKVQNGKLHPKRVFNLPENFGDQA